MNNERTNHKEMEKNELLETLAKLQCVLRSSNTCEQFTGSELVKARNFIISLEKLMELPPPTSKT